MLKSWRSLVVAAVAGVLSHATVATAQNVIARKAPAGSTVELMVNAVKVGTATADANGDATLPFTIELHDGVAEMDGYVHVDTCGEVRRIVLVEKSHTPPLPEPGCTRRDVSGLFLFRRVTNLVVDTGAPIPTVRLRQGSVDLSAKEEQPGSSTHDWDTTPTGLMVFGGAGLSKFSDALSNLCGNVTPCEGGDSRTTYTFGGSFWLGPFVGVEGSFIKPPSVNASGTGTNFLFNSVLSSQLYVINGKVGVPIEKVKIYGQGGTNYHKAKQSTTERIDDLALSVNDAGQIVAGGTQEIELHTAGWGYQFGGGAEIWFKDTFAVYGEFNRIHLSGHGIDGREGELTDNLNSILFGLRVKIHR